MAPIITTAKIVCKAKEARVKVLQAFHQIVEYAHKNEPGVLRYLVTLPLNDEAGAEIYTIEEYESPVANDIHIATPPVQDLINIFTSGHVLVAAPEVHTSPIAYNKVPQSTPRLLSKPAIVLTHLAYKTGTLMQALEGWKHVVDNVTANEENTLAYTVLNDEKGIEVRTVEVYENWEYVENVHLKNPVIAENQKKNGADIVYQGAVRLRAVDGFFGKEVRQNL
ncbi:hypothetical protein CC78DRAFT_239450 [Lojkania enalia]|uniref:ABM domain-containing protein n=1 Tax=Lojkania enalia TaxID=147567 RepID=A0A9P4NAR6_9PLEO|nr:hypothetical protein CC78DRAFT_239450 [Didymosphaeria enalia]